MDKKMTEMTNLEIAEILEPKFGQYGLSSAMAFFKELGIEIESVSGERFYNGKLFYREWFFDKSFIQKLLKILEPEKREIVKQTVLEMQSRQPTENETPTNQFNFNNNNTASANAINENTISISTLSQLTNQVSQSTTLTNEVKTEIQNIISKLEYADDKDSYFDLFFKLLDKLQGSGLVPEWVTKSAKFARKFIDK